MQMYYFVTLNKSVHIHNPTFFFNSYPSTVIGSDIIRRKTSKSVRTFVKVSLSSKQAASCRIHVYRSVSFSVPLVGTLW